MGFLFCFHVGMCGEQPPCCLTCMVDALGGRWTPRYCPILDLLIFGPSLGRGNAQVPELRGPLFSLAELRFLSVNVQSPRLLCTQQMHVLFVVFPIPGLCICGNGTRPPLFPPVFPSTPPQPIYTHVHVHGSARTSALLSVPGTRKPAGNQPVKTSSLPSRRTSIEVTGILAPSSARRALRT